MAWHTTIILAIFATTASAQCNFNQAEYINELKNPSNIKSIEVTVPKSAKWEKNFIRIISSSTTILPELKKSFKSKIEVNYDFGSCEFWGSIKQNGDFFDHIRLINQKPVRSLNVKLDEGNILNSVNFKLLIPDTRNDLKEIFGISILRSLDFITPETFKTSVIVNNVKSSMLFQEAARKELLERNNRREGPIFEADESPLWINGRVFNDDIALTRLENKNWFLKGSSSESITLRAYNALQFAYIHRANNQIKNKAEMISLEHMEAYIDPNSMLTPITNENLSFPKFHFLMQALSAEHGLVPHNRKFYFNTFENQFEPIYYDGDVLGKDDRERAMKLIPFNKNLISNAYHKLNLEEYKSIILSEEIRLNAKSYFNERVNLSNDEANILFEKYWNVFIYRIDNLIKSIKDIKKYKTDIIQYDHEVNTFYKRASLHPYTQTLGTDLNKLSDGAYELKILNDKNLLLSLNDVAKILNKNEMSDIRTTILKAGPLDNQEEIYKEKFNDTQLIYSKDLKVDIDKKNKKISITQKKSDDWILFNNLDLDNWDIGFIGLTSGVEQKTGQRFNKYGMTGCLNFYNSKFTKLNITVAGGQCEDSLNIVKSEGDISSLLVMNAYADAIDFDFSNITISKLIVNSSGNDCFDVSGGNYEINEAKLEKCGDKGLSVGEASSLKASKLNIRLANIGISSKDYSVMKIDNANISNITICAEAKQKKQEFGGAVISIKSLECDGPIETDKNSLFKKY